MIKLDERIESTGGQTSEIDKKVLDDKLKRGTVCTFITERASTEYPFITGSESDKYTIDERVGAGGFSSVYRVKKKGQVFLLKILRKGKSNESLTKEQNFVDVTHKNFQIGKVVIGNKTFHATIQNCDNGISLEDAKNISLEKLITIFKNLLIFAKHQRYREDGAFTHYDIKPANVLVNAETGDIICLLDYGSALRFNDDRENVAIASTTTFCGLDILKDDDTLIKYCDFVYDVACILGSFLDIIDKRKLNINLISDEYNVERCKECATSRLDNYYSDYCAHYDNSTLKSLRNNDYKKQLCRIADDITTDIIRYLDNIVTLNANTIAQTSLNGLDKFRSKYKSYPYKSFKMHDYSQGNHVLFNSFFRERREIAYILALSQPKDCHPFVFEMDHTFSSETDIQYGITKTLTGKRVSFDHLTAFLSKYDDNKIMFIAVIRCYNKKMVQNLVDMLNSLEKQCKKINYVILAEKNIMGDAVGEDFEFENVRTEIISAFKEWGKSIYYTRHYQIFDNNGNNSIQRPQDLDIRLLANKSMGTLDDNKYNRLSTLIIDKFNGREQESREILPSEIISPLTAEDIILFAKETAIITVTQNHKTGVITVILNTKDLLSNTAKGSLDDAKYNRLRTLLIDKFQPKEIRPCEIISPLTAEDIILFAERTGIISVTQNHKTGVITVIQNTQDLLSNKAKGSLDDEKYNRLRTLLIDKFKTKVILPSEIISPLTAEDIILFAERTGIITVTKYDFDTGALTVTPGIDLFDSLLNDYNANDIVTNLFGEYLKRMSGSILSEDYIKSIAEKINSKLEAIPDDAAQKSIRNRLFGKLKDEFPPMRFNDQPVTSPIKFRPCYKLSREEYFLSENICQLVSALDGNDKRWQEWLTSINNRIDLSNVENITSTKLSNYLDKCKHPYKKWETRVVYNFVVAAFILFCIVIFICYIFSIKSEHDSSEASKIFIYDQSQIHDSDIHSGSIFSDEIYLAIKNDTRHSWVLNSLQLVSSESVFDIDDISTTTITDKSLQPICKAIYFTPNTIDRLVHINDVKIDGKSNPCDFWYMPESCKATFTVSNFPTTAGYILDWENYNRKISFYLTIKSDEIFEIDEEELKNAFFFTVDGNKNVLTAKSVEITPIPEFFNKPNEAGYIVTMFAQKSASDLDKLSIDAQLCIDTNDIVRYSVGNGQIIQHFDEAFYDSSVTLADSLFFDKDVDASSLILYPEINVISRSASNAKYVIFEPEYIPDECSVDFFNDEEGPSMFFSEGLYGGSTTHYSNHITEKIADGTADSISDIEYTFPYYVYNNCGQYIAHDAENDILRTIGDNGVDTTPPVVEVKSVEEREDGRFRLTLLIKDDYPLPFYSEWNYQYRWECDRSFVYGANNLEYLGGNYPMSENGVEDTSCVELAFMVEPMNDTDSIIIAPGFITDAAGIPNDKVITCHLKESSVYAQFDTVAKVYDPDKEYQSYDDYINGEDVTDFSKPDAFYYVVSYYPAEEIDGMLLEESSLDMHGFYGVPKVEKISYTNSYALIFTDVEYTSEYGVYVTVNDVTAVSNKGDTVNSFRSPVMDPKPLSASPIGGLDWDTDAPNDLIGKIQLRFSDGSVPSDDIDLSSSTFGFNCEAWNLIHIEDDVFQIRFENVELYNPDRESYVSYCIKAENLLYDGEIVRCSGGYSEDTTLTIVNTSDQELVTVEKTD